MAEQAQSHIDLQQLADLANTLADIVYVMRLEPDMGFEFVSDAVTDFVGYTPQEHYDNPNLGMQLIEPEDVPVLASVAGHPLGEVFEYTVRWITRDGRRIWTNHRCVTTARDDGSIVLHGIARDVTALKEAEARFRLLAENAEDMVVLVGSGGRAEWVSPSLGRLLGYTSTEFLHLTWRELVHPDDVEAVASAPNDLRSGDSEVTRVVRMRKKDRTYKWCLIAGRRAAGGDVTLTIRDHDEQVLASQAVRIEQAQRRSMLDTMLDPLVLFEAVRDESGEVVDFRYADVNWAACSYLGMEREHLVRTTMLTLFPNQVELGLFEAYVQAMDSGVPLVRDNEPIRASPDVVRYFDIRAVPVGPDHLSIIWRNVSDRVNAQQRVERAERHYRLLAENSSDVVALLDAAGHLLWVSHSVTTVSGWTPEDLLSGPLAAFVHPDDAAVAMTLIVDQSRQAVIRLVHADGHYVWVSAISREVTTSGEERQFVVALRDITEQHDAVEQLRASEERLHNLLDSMLEPFVLLEAVRDERSGVVDFTFADANPAALSVYGLTEDELIGQQLSVLESAAWQREMFDRFVAVVDEGAAVVLDDWSFPKGRAQGQQLHYDVRAVRVGDAVSLTWRDVTDRYEAARHIAESEELFRLLAENASDVVLRIHGEGISWVSPSVQRTLGWPVSTWEGQSLRTFIHADDEVDLSDVHGVMTTRLRVRDAAGTFHWVQVRANALPDRDGQKNVVASIQMIDDVVAYETELQRRATFDDLTGALKRGEAIRLLTNMTHYWRAPGDQSAVLYVDVDDFKKVNDTYGHVIGDEVLRVVSERMRRVMRSGDLFARMGGDEFIVVLDGLHDLNEAVRIAENIRDVVTADIPVAETVIHVSVSIGVIMRLPGEDPDAVISRADHAMYRAKRTGRNRVVAEP
jgi:diguanylate cyclase (GGDEF)-like protein/PAS domain S-box-containing protein